MDNSIFVIKDGKILGLTDEGKKLESITIPACVSAIADSAFRGNTALKSVNFEGNGLKSIGNSAFRDCVNLENIVLPKSVEFVGELALYNTAQKTYDKLYSLNIAKKEYYAPKYTYEFLGRDTLPIGAYIEPSVGYFAEGVTIESNIKDFAESGCNIMIGIGQSRWGTMAKEYFEILENLEKNGAMMMIKNETEHGKICYNMACDKYASVAGEHVVDEPGTAAWVPGIKVYTRKIMDEEGNPTDDRRQDGVVELVSLDKCEKKRKWNEKTPTKLYYINLLPVNSPKRAFVLGAEDYNVKENIDKIYPELENTAEYEYYYKTYMDYFKPDVFSYDFYPLWANGLGCNAYLSFPDLNARHFEQLAVVRRYTQTYSKEKYGKETPFWNFVQISGWGNQQSGSRAANYFELSWQINTAFAFGSKGYQYYCYNDYGDVTGQGKPGSWWDTPMYINGTKNEKVYKMMQKVNANAQGMAKWLLNASVDHLAQFGTNPNGGPQCANPEVISPEQFIPVDKDMVWSLKDTAGKNHLVSYMKYFANNNDFSADKPAQTQELYFICNNSTLETNSGDITLNFKNKVKGSYIYNGVEKEFEGDTLTVSTICGEGFAVLLR